MTVDIAVKNCKIVSSESIVSAGIAIDGGKFVAIAKDADLPQARRTIDAGGKYVLPGVIDSHVHLGCEHPLDEDIRADTAAAAYGGTTTVANTLGPRFAMCAGSYTEKLDEWIQLHNSLAFTDSVLNATLTSEIHIKGIPLLAKKYGITGFKFLLNLKGALSQKLSVLDTTDGAVYTGFKEITALGPPTRAMIHAENVDVVDWLLPKEEERREDLAQWANSRPSFVEALDIDRVVSIARVTKTPLYIVHVSSADGVDAVARAKVQGVDLIAETCPHYLILTKNVGRLGKQSPSLRDAEDNERLWEGISQGIIDCLGTDNTSTMKESKQSIWKGGPGLSSIESFLPLMLSEGVNKGRITLEKLVEVCCVNNAKAMGIYPEKGTIRLGSDADLVIIDLNKKVKLSAASLHQLSDFSIYEGKEVKGYSVLTMLRGNVVMENGNLMVEPGVGRYIPRTLQS